jgi:transketolase
LKGAYVLQQTSEDIPDIILIASGSEVHLIVETSVKLEKRGINVRVVSCPCLDIFEQQPLKYRRKILVPDVPVVSVEASSTFGWAKYAHYNIGMTTFGASAPGGENMKRFGFTSENILEKIISLFGEITNSKFHTIGLLACQRR